MKVSALHIYPIKSTGQVPLQTSKILSTGLEHDREWLLIDANQKLMTARDYPELLRIRSHVQRNQLVVRTPLESHAFQSNIFRKKVTFQFFNEQLSGKHFSDQANEWLSDYLGVKCQLVHQKGTPRPMLEKRGGESGDQVNYGDEAPILLLGEESLAELNGRLEKPVTMTHFRPNIVVQGSEAFAEDQWKLIRMGDCEFKVAQACQRCVFTTIDPTTLEKDRSGEPLKTLARYRKGPAGGVIFGVHLIPRKRGEIKVGDVVEVLE